MPSLSELQSSMARALLAVEPAARRLPEAWFGAHGERGLRTHRNNLLGACCNALRLSYPTLDRLIGAEYFDALAAEFVRSTPPTAPALAVYGEGFTAFVSDRAAPADRALLQEVGRFDWLFERVAQAPVEEFDGPSLALEGGVRLRLAGSLRLFSTTFPVDALRAGGTLSEVATPAMRHLALWRRKAGVAVQPVQELSAAFLAALLRDEGLEAALHAATAAQGGTGTAEDLSRQIETDILRASYARLSTH